MTREEKRRIAAEAVCKAFRASVACEAYKVADKQRYADLALKWLLDWMDNAPKSVKYGPLDTHGWHRWARAAKKGARP